MHGRQDIAPWAVSLLRRSLNRRLTQRKLKCRFPELPVPVLAFYAVRRYPEGSPALLGSILSSGMLRVT